MGGGGVRGASAGGPHITWHSQGIKGVAVGEGILLGLPLLLNARAFAK